MKNLYCWDSRTVVPIVYFFLTMRLEMGLQNFDYPGHNLNDSIVYRVGWALKIVDKILSFFNALHVKFSSLIHCYECLILKIDFQQQHKKILINYFELGNQLHNSPDNIFNDSAFGLVAYFLPKMENIPNIKCL